MRRLLFLVALLSAAPVWAQQAPPITPFNPGITPPIFGGPSVGVNGGGQVLSSQILAPDGTAAAPSYSFASAPTSGVYLIGSQPAFSLTGTGRMVMLTAGFQLKSDYALEWSSSTVNNVSDVSLSRGAANRLDLATGDSFNLVGGGGSFQVATVPIMSSTAPTVTSAGTSPSVSGTNTAAFRVNVGTGGTASAIVMAMPAATTGWNCDAQNITANAANRANQHVVQQSSTTTAVTVQNQTISTGAALAFTASDIVRFICVAY